MSRIAQSLDSVSFDEYRARFTGTVVLEDNAEINATALDEVSVGVIIFKARDVSIKVDKNGNVARIGVLAVSDLRVVEDDLKEILVERLGLYNSEIPVPIEPKDAGPDAYVKPREYRDDDEMPTWSEITHRADENGEILEPEPTVVGSIHEGRPAGPGREGVARFADFDGGVADRSGAEVVGHINRRDGALSNFLNEGI